ncbi:MAG: WD40 repeat domain-containing protein [Pseudomonadota bacterium]
MIQRAPYIRHLACSYDGDLVAAAESTGFVQIWNVQSAAQTARFKTTLDFGGNRLAISRDGQHLAAGAYHDHGLTLYSTQDGKELWRRTDLKQIQDVRISMDDAVVICGHGGDCCEMLDITSGESEQSLHPVEDLLQSAYEDIAIVDGGRSNHYMLTDFAFQKIAQVARTSFAALDFAFAPHLICVTESGVLVRCYGTADGRELWRYDPGSRDGVHVITLAYNEPEDSFVGIALPYKHGGDRRLVVIRAKSGQFVSAVTLGTFSKAVFCCKGSVLLTSDGILRASLTGEQQGTLTFFPATTAG